MCKKLRLVKKYYINGKLRKANQSNPAILTAPVL